MIRSLWRIFGPCALFALLLSSRSKVFAQVDRAGLNGTVTDDAHRVLPGARVTAVQLSTGLERSALTASAGPYDLPELPLGTYRVTYSAPGFQPKIVDA